MPPKRTGSKSKSNSRAPSQQQQQQNTNSNGGRAEWEQMIDNLGTATLQSFDNKANNNVTPFDAKEYIQQQSQSGGRNEFSDAIANSSKIRAFLEEKQEEFDREILGTNDGNVALPLYVPRVNMVEATHVMPAEPAATDAFRFHTMPEKIDQLPNSGPNWVNICNNAIEAATFRMKLKQHQQQQAAAAGAAAITGGTGVGASSQSASQKEIRLTKLTVPGRVADFIPIILVPGGASSVVQLSNVKDLLDNGLYTPPFQHWMDNASGETHLARRDEKREPVYVSPAKLLADTPSVKFTQFKVVDDPADVDNWDHVCACFVSGQLWQFEGWYGGNPEKNQPRNLFDIHVKGFMPFFEDEKVPFILKEWKVVPLQLSRRNSKAHMSIRVARIFWENLFEFMESHPYFRQFTLEATTAKTSSRR